MTVVVEGAVRYVRHPDGRAEITAAPRVARMALTEIKDPLFEASGNRVLVAGQLVYRVRQWEQSSHSLLCDLVEDRRLA